MNPGKNKCAYLKEIRKRIATENGIPLEQRECTFKGECSGTCPFCEAEMRYIEKELHKRRTLGKAVTVAGIALSSVMLFPACGPKNALQGEPELPSEPDTTLTVTDTVPADTVAEIPPPPSWDPENPPFVGVIDEEPWFSDEGFPPEYGTPQEWFLNQLQDSVLRAKIKGKITEAAIEYTTKDGYVKDVRFTGFPNDDESKEIQRELEAIMRKMPRWNTTTPAPQQHILLLEVEK